ncbi:MAG: hypothetical protein ABI675_18970 [Chitinophagaceae bacterium]
MKSVYVSILFIVLLPCCMAVAQSISSSLPQKIERSEKYLFYLHGGVVTVLGNNAINQSVPEWGPYEYLNILDSLRRRGFNIISENRKEVVPDSFYVNKISYQIDTLFTAGVNPRNILIVGASAGSDIVINVSAKLKNDKMKYVIMGGCWPDTYKDYLPIELYGHFLSIIETSDPHGTCCKIFEKRKQVKSYKEITLNTGLSHGFIYKGYKEWIDPIVKWLKETN